MNPITLPPEAPPSKGSAAVYRLFDAARSLLYIGSTRDPGRRWMDHKREKAWWPDVATYTMEWHPSRSAAYEIEGTAVKAEKPSRNVLGTPKGAVLGQNSHAAWVARRKAIGVFGDYTGHPDGATLAFARARADYQARIARRAGPSPEQGA